jgi:hypothetical protein
VRSSLVARREAGAAVAALVAAVNLLHDRERVATPIARDVLLLVRPRGLRSGFGTAFTVRAGFSALGAFSVGWPVDQKARPFAAF